MPEANLSPHSQPIPGLPSQPPSLFKALSFIKKLYEKSPAIAPLFTFLAGVFLGQAAQNWYQGIMVNVNSLVTLIMLFIGASFIIASALIKNVGIKANLMERGISKQIEDTHAQVSDAIKNTK